MARRNSSHAARSTGLYQPTRLAATGPHGSAPPALRRLDSPESILDLRAFDTLEHSPPHVPPKAIRDFRRKWSSDGVHSGEVRKLLSLNERDERGAACVLTAPGPPTPPEQDGRRQSRTERAASVLCAAARGRAVRREFALVHATATYLQARGRPRLTTKHTHATHPPCHRPTPQAPTPICLPAYRPAPLQPAAPRKRALDPNHYPNPNQSRVLLHLHECRRKRTDSFRKHGVALYVENKAYMAGQRGTSG